MGTKYIIDNVNGTIPQQVIYGALSATTFYGDGSNLSGITIPSTYKVYTALLTQTGSTAPVSTVLENTLGGTVVWTYDIIGVYNATLNGAFLPNKTVVFCTKQMPGNGGITIYGSRVNNDTVSIRVSDSITNVDGELTDASIEIRVYN